MPKAGKKSGHVSGMCSFIQRNGAWKTADISAEKPGMPSFVDHRDLRKVLGEQPCSASRR